MTLWEIVDVSLFPLCAEQLWGCSIDIPKPFQQADGRALDIEGWVLGRDVPAVAVEILHDGKLLRRTRVTGERPDVAAVHPQAKNPERSAFGTSVSVAGMNDLDIEVRAVLRDRSRVPVGRIRGRRRWRVVTQETKMPLVSIIIPCYNQAHFLPDAIQSALLQTYAHLETVVVDDGSTDNTSEVAARHPGVRCVRQEHQGLAEARNTGLRDSNGEHIVFLDADDRLLPDALDTGLRSLREHPECAFVVGHARFIEADDSVPSHGSSSCGAGVDYGSLLRGASCPVAPAVAMFRREAFEQVGVFNPSWDACADYEMYLRIARQFPAFCHHGLVAEYRQHGGNMTRDFGLMLKSAVSVLRSQRRHAREQMDAYRAGLRFWKSCYGIQLVHDVRVQVQNGEWWAALQGMLVLLTEHPRASIRLLRDVRS
jgi:glycosyltransferase involved in cell wall biosynthesis